jgi:hypothetical protein
MNLYGRSSRWAAALALGLLGLIGVSAATVHAAPARSAADAFELTLEVTDTWQWEDEVLFERRVGTFRSRGAFCATGTFADEGRWRFTCDDGTGSLTVAIVPIWNRGAPRWNTTWRILDGSGSYAGFHGRGSLQGELLSREGSESKGVETWRSTFQGAVDRDSAAPTIAISRATATKLPRPAGAYSIKVALTLRDDVDGNPVSYTLRAFAGGGELARKFGSATTGAVSMTLRIRPPAGARTVRLILTGADPVGNAVSVRRALSLPR